jgi:tetratricopeptide (TPR) repeat protein
MSPDAPARRGVVTAIEALMELNTSLFDGLRFHQAGHLAEAEAIYRAVLRADPNHADALHLLGVVHHQRGDSVRGADFIRSSVALRPEEPRFHCNLADACLGLGRYEEAAESACTALRLQPEYPQALVNRGSALFALKRFAEAEADFRQARRLRPEDALAARNLADALREQGRFSDAVGAYEEAIRLDPNNGAAHSNLGLLLLQIGDGDRALEQCRRAVTLQPNSAAAVNHLGKCLLMMGRFAEAMSEFERALALDSRLPELCLNLGYAWLEMADWDQASAWFEQALTFSPNDVEARIGQAWTVLEAGDPERAGEIFQEVLAGNADRIEARSGLAQARWQAGDAAAALQEYESTRRQRPESAAWHVRISEIHASSGDLGQAVAHARTALRLNPRCWSASAQIATILRGKIPDEDLARMREFLDRGELPDFARPGLLFGLAQVYDARGEYAAAAEFMTRANDLQKTYWEERNQGYDPESHRAQVDGIIERFDSRYFDRVRGWGLDTRRPVFIVGMPRSSTTLTEQILASHSKVHGAGERRFVGLGFSRIAALTGRKETPLGCLHRLTPEVVHLVTDWHLGELHRLDGGVKERIVDKMPDNYALLGWIVTMFPEARIIHCRRDIRDVALSCWITNFAQIRWADDLLHLAERIREYLRLMKHWRAVLPVPMLEVDYEDLVNDAEGTSQRLIDWLGLDWEPACLQFHTTKRLVRTASVAQVRQPIYKHSLARWTHYEGALNPLLTALSGDTREA